MVRNLPHSETIWLFQIHRIQSRCLHLSFNRILVFTLVFACSWADWWITGNAPFPVWSWLWEKHKDRLRLRWQTLASLCRKILEQSCSLIKKKIHNMQMSYMNLHCILPTGQSLVIPSVWNISYLLENSRANKRNGEKKPVVFLWTCFMSFVCLVQYHLKILWLHDGEPGTRTVNVFKCLNMILFSVMTQMHCIFIEFADYNNNNFFILNLFKSRVDKVKAEHNLQQQKDIKTNPR